ncbi:MAG: bifunctional demethylmenaquinone methyltransferase/2-methoxy-6-polyprenyl-1,4-benzoquinol methylase UbiE [Alphaproteobacteria bacterium]
MSEKFTDFGFDKVSLLEKAGRVKDVFKSVASRYDFMNDLMSLGLHRFWKREFLAKIPAKPHMKVLDLGGGTGDISLGIVKKYGHLRPHITLCDPSKEMMEQGQEKSYDKNLFQGIEWVEGSAENLPFDDGSMDVCTMAFSLRNVTKKKRALEEIYRVLKPGGCFLCLEFSKVNSNLKSFYNFYSFSVIPQLGKWVAKDKEAYDYLVESIDMFMNQDQLKELLEQVGFSHVTYKNLTQGIVAIHEGWKK